MILWTDGLKDEKKSLDEDASFLYTVYNFIIRCVLQYSVISKKKKSGT